MPKTKEQPYEESIFKNQTPGPQEKNPCSQTDRIRYRQTEVRANMETLITPADLQSAYLDGMWHGALGVGLIIFGIIGWPATRYVLGVLSYPFTRRSPRTPIGSPYWDKYNAPHRKADIDFHAMSVGGRRK